MGGRDRGRRTSWLGVRLRNLRLHALLTALLLALGALAVPVVASAAPGDVGVEGPSHSGTGSPTGTKRATSALWFNDGAWWGNLWDTASSDFHIFRFNAATSSWADTGVATDPRANTHHDVLWDGTVLYVASYQFVNDGLPAEPNFPTTMRRFSYDSGQKTYTQLTSTLINNQRVETLTIDKDSTGRVWATWQQGNRIYLNVTGTDGKTWGTPFPHPSSLSSVSVDDTSAVIAFGPGKMGVMWSRQVDDANDGMLWSYHVDGASTTDWTAPVAAVSGQGSGDDHMNMKWLDSSGGRVFAAIKTSFSSASEPLIQLLALDGTTWSAHTIATVAECPNRVIVLIDEGTQMLRTFSTYPKPSGTTNAGNCTSSGGAIYEKSAPLNDISFTTAKTVRILDADQYAHNVTSTKQNLNSTARGTGNSGLLVLADVSSTNRYWHYHDPSGGGAVDTTPPTVTGTSPLAGASGVAVTANVTGQFSEPMDASTVSSATVTLKAGTTSVPAVVTYNSTDRVATLNPSVDLAAGTAYTATIRGGVNGVKDVAGNALASDQTWTFTTASGGGTSETVTLTATADSYVSSGTTGTNYGTSTALGVDSSPAEVTYLKFDVSAYAGRTLESATLQLHSAGNASVGKQNVKPVASGSWTEGVITYGIRPRLGTSIGTLGPTTTNTSYNVPLTVSGLGELGQELNLGLDSVSSDGLDLSSREAGSTVAPKLVLRVGPTGVDTTPPVVTGTSPLAGGTGVAVTANVTGQFSEPMDASTVSSATVTLKAGTTSVPAVVTYNSTDRVATLNPSVDLAAGTAYTATIRGGVNGVKDVAGNALASDQTWTFTTASGGGTSETVTLTATADSYVSSGTTGTNYGTSTALGVDSSPAEVTYLKFDVSAYAGRTLESATLQLHSAGNASVGKQNVKPVASGSWTEGVITYGIRPGLGTSIGTLGPTTTNTSYNVPLTVSGLGELGQELNLGLDSVSSDGLDLSSREAGSTVAPKLVLTFR